MTISETYSCSFPGCTVRRTKEEGGSTFTVCEAHWNSRAGSAAPVRRVEDLLADLVPLVSQAMLWPQVREEAGLRGKPAGEIAEVLLETYRSYPRALARDFQQERRVDIGLRLDETGVSADRVVALYAAAARVAGLSVRLCAHAYMPPLFEHVACMIYDPDHVPGPDRPKGCWRYVDPWYFEPKLGELEREPADERQVLLTDRTEVGGAVAALPLALAWGGMGGSAELSNGRPVMAGDVLLVDGEGEVRVNGVRSGVKAGAYVVEIPGPRAHQTLHDPVDARTVVHASSEGAGFAALGLVARLEESLVEMVRSGSPEAGGMLADAVLLRRKLESVVKR